MRELWQACEQDADTEVPFTTAARIKRNRVITPVSLLLILLMFTSHASAQNAASREGIESGNYHLQGSFELGYRFENTNGSDPLYDTFVNQQQGPRFLEQTLNMRSLNHQGVLFDNLFLSSFGWGGDPENATRFRISKNKWYNFNASFRRDQNFWDYNLLANPLNPTNPFIQLNDSPHEMQTVRRMYDYNLTLLPQSRVRFRLGYTRSNMDGPAFSKNCRQCCGETSDPAPVVRMCNRQQ